MLVMGRRNIDVSGPGPATTRAGVRRPTSLCEVESTSAASAKAPTASTLSCSPIHVRAVACSAPP